MLELQNVHTYYGNIHALKGISLEIKSGEIITLIGANGAGKSTTLMSICGVVPPRPVRSCSEASASHRRARIISSRWVCVRFPRGGIFSRS